MDDGFYLRVNHVQCGVCFTDAVCCEGCCIRIAGQITAAPFGDDDGLVVFLRQICCVAQVFHRVCVVTDTEVHFVVVHAFGGAGSKLIFVVVQGSTNPVYQRSIGEVRFHAAAKRRGVVGGEYQCHVRADGSCLFCDAGISCFESISCGSSCPDVHFTADTQQNGGIDGCQILECLLDVAVIRAAVDGTYGAAFAGEVPSDVDHMVAAFIRLDETFIVRCVLSHFNIERNDGFVLSGAVILFCPYTAV